MDMPKFDQNSLPPETEIIAEGDMNPALVEINVADDVLDEAIQNGVCKAMCLKWVENGVETSISGTASLRTTLNDIKWLQHGEHALPQRVEIIT